MKKKWIAVGMLVVTVMVGSVIGVTEVRAQDCQMEGCTQLGEHEHYNCEVEGCKQSGEHEHYNCEVTGCNQTNEHEHNKQENHHSGHGNRGHH